MTPRYHASCLCQQVTFSVAGFEPLVAHCHCTMCRKFHGSAFGTLAATQDLQWLSGHSLLKEFTAANGTVRTFCSQCGSSIGFRSKGVAPEQMEVALGLFDHPIPVSPDTHIYTHYKANWYTIEDSLPQKGEGRRS
ncbi:GFA family protein [Vibrio fluvialis]|nr:GFA family protein [Vibrio fluvialis]